MLCTFCGTENRPEYKFCGTCGVRLERRQVERRTHQGGASTKCTGCGYLNEPALKFCGMCGTRVERRVQERRDNAVGPRAAAIANAQLPSPDAGGRTTTQVIEPPQPSNNVPASLPRRGEPAIFRDEPGRKVPHNGTNISGPSFLGLNAQQESDGEYLLEDEPSGRGLRKLVLLVILAAILGLVFVQWRSSFKANPKPTPVKTEPSSAPTPVPQGSNQPQGSATTGQPTDDAAKSSPTDVNADGAAAGPKATQDLKDQKAQKNQNPESASAQSSENAGSPVETAAAAEVPADKKATGGEAAQTASVVKPPEEARIPDYKPSAALLRAQQYIRGHGVQQNCEQGLLYLRAATDKNDPGAAIQMAALYSSGLCVKQDRVMAYRWFNSAHELQPGNMYIQKNMDQLWAQMTSQERRLAGY
ncbi:MAG: zinc ribbon domain-containing protein [Acidobacteriia bacterium]|nr:zinc ribbon domain-containing protein [Terriglobia bacterium]